MGLVLIPLQCLLHLLCILICYLCVHHHPLLQSFILFFFFWFFPIFYFFFFLFFFLPIFFFFFFFSSPFSSSLPLWLTWVLTRMITDVWSTELNYALSSQVVMFRHHTLRQLCKKVIYV